MKRTNITNDELDSVELVQNDPIIVNELNNYNESSMIDTLKKLKEKYKHLNISYDKNNYVLIRYAGGFENVLVPPEDECRSLLLFFDGSKFNMIYSQFDKIRCNDEAEKFINNNDIKKLEYEYCYEGTMFTLLWCSINNHWRYHTRSCLSADNSEWQKGMPYGVLIRDSMQQNNIVLPDTPDGKFYEKDCHYFFVLVDYRNKNISSYEDKFKEKKYSKIIFISKRKNGTMYDLPINEKTVTELGYMLPEKGNFKSLVEVKKDLETKSKFEEGWIIKAYLNDKKYVVMKLQTEMYKKVKNIKPNVNNKWTLFLELYQKFKLTEYLEYLPESDTKIVKIIHTTFLILATELLQLYHKTRKKRNDDLYKILPPCYKKALFEIHGMFIKKKTTELKNGESTDELNMEVRADKQSISISPKDISSYLRSINSTSLSNLIVDRILILSNVYTDNDIFNTRCQDALILAFNIEPSVNNKKKIENIMKRM
jgi:hypothetical protein